MSQLSARKADRDRLLCAIYREADGDCRTMVDVTAVGEDLGFPPEETYRFAVAYDKDGALEAVCAGIQCAAHLRPRGVALAEAIMAELGESAAIADRNRQRVAFLDHLVSAYVAAQGKPADAWALGDEVGLTHEESTRVATYLDGMQLVEVVAHRGAQYKIIPTPEAMDALEEIGADDPELTQEDCVARLLEMRVRLEVESGWIEPAPARNVFRRDGDAWTLNYEGKTVLVKELKGLRYIAYLLRHAGKEFNVLALLEYVEGRPLLPPHLAAAQGQAEREEDKPPTPGAGAPIEVLDRETIRQVRGEIKALERRRDNARARGDSKKADSLEDDRRELVRYIAPALKPNGDSRLVLEAQKQAYDSITASVRRALEAICAVHPTLFTHLDNSIKRGRFISYRPDRSIFWILE